MAGILAFLGIVNKDKKDDSVKPKPNDEEVKNDAVKLRS